MNFFKAHFSTLLIAAAVIITGLILGKAYMSKGKPDDTVSVIGLGEESFDSDLIVWRASFSRRSMELKDAYAQLNADIRKVKSYLKSRGISDEEMVFEAADIPKNGAISTTMKAMSAKRFSTVIRSIRVSK